MEPAVKPSLKASGPNRHKVSTDVATKSAEKMSERLSVTDKRPSSKAKGRDAAKLCIRKAGLLTTVQDQGRSHMAHWALSRGGAADPMAARLANLLVGNHPDEAVIEITGPGPQIYSPCDLWMASYGAEHELVLQELAGRPLRKAMVLPLHRPLFIPAGSLLQWRAPRQGWRSWVAFAGGLQTPLVLGSRSAHLAAGIGGQRLEAQDLLALNPEVEGISVQRALTALGGELGQRATYHGECAWPRWRIASTIPDGWPLLDVPVIKGRHWAALDPAEQQALMDQVWKVSSQSNRQGLRLEASGEGRPLNTASLPQLASEAVHLGTVQLPPAGLPVILMGEHQTTGGYPRVLEVASAAYPMLSQAAAGNFIQFHLITLEEADRMSYAMQRLQIRVEQALQAKFGQRFHDTEHRR